MQIIGIVLQTTPVVILSGHLLVGLKQTVQQFKVRFSIVLNGQDSLIFLLMGVFGARRSGVRRLRMGLLQVMILKMEQS